MNRSIRMAGRVLKALGVSALVLILSGWSGMAVFAEEAGTCAEDIARFCKDTSREGGNVGLCLRQHEIELSPMCRDMIQEFQKRIDDVKRACTADINKFCQGIETGQGRIAKCLNEHAGELTPACAEQMIWLNAKLKGN